MPDEQVHHPVRQALDALEGLADRPLEEHVPAFDGVHRALQDALAQLDDA